MRRCAGKGPLRGSAACGRRVLWQGGNGKGDLSAGAGSPPKKSACGGCRLGVVAALQVVAQDDGQQVHAQHQQDEDQARAVLERAGLLDVRAGGGQHVHMIGQGHDRAEDGVRVLGRIEDGGGEHDGGRFTGGAGHAQDGAGEHARHGAGQDHAGDGLGLAGTQGQGGLAVGVGHGAQALLGGADDDGQGQHGQGQDAGQDADAHAAEGHEERKPEQAKDHGRHPGQVVDPQAHHAGEGGVARVFMQVDGRGHPQGEGQQQGAQGQDGRAHDAGQDAAGGHHLAGRRGEEFPAEGGQALHQQEKADGHQQDDVEGGHQPQGAEHGALDEKTAARIGCRKRHGRAP